MAFNAMCLHLKSQDHFTNPKAMCDPALETKLRSTKSHNALIRKRHYLSCIKVTIIDMNCGIDVPILSNIVKWVCSYHLVGLTVGLVLCFFELIRQKHTTTLVMYGVYLVSVLVCLCVFYSVFLILVYSCLLEVSFDSQNELCMH